MQIDLLDIQAFLAIIECGSFQLAANQLNLSQAAVSHRLRKLEDSLGLRLVARTTREVMLTDVGRSFFHARAAVQELGRSIEAVRAHDAQAGSKVAIAFLPTMAAALLSPVLRAFAQEQPGTAVRIFDNSIHEIPELVESRSAAFGVTVALALRGELVQDRIALPIDDAIGPMREQLRWRYETQCHALALQMVREGLGITVVPRLHVAACDTLALVPMAEPAIRRPLVLVTRRGDTLSPSEAHLRDAVVRHILERLAAS